MSLTLTDAQSKNRKLWDLWAELHVASDYYDVGAFVAGGNSLKNLDRELVGDVTGKRVLHLQCHFGLDSISLSRLGAKVTGVDFSDVAIGHAKKLASVCNSDAKFVVGDAENLAASITERYDMVYMSYGVMSWIENLDRWSDGVAAVLDAGGELCLIELHPFLGMLSDDGKEFEYSYFEAGPEVTEESTSYAGCDHRPMEIVQWGHSIGGIVSAVARAGLFVTELSEYPYSSCKCYPYLRETTKGRYVAEQFGVEVPHMFSLRARRS